ncbi:MAG: phosphomannomutase/phosphoglucomutase [Pseudomonadota bacterium]
MSDSHQFHPTLLREYDIRGVIGETLGEDDAYHVGRSFGSVVARRGGTRICLGYDGRLSSPDMAAAVARGFVDCGLEVLEVGRGPTPMLYFSVHHLTADAGLMITGSHNPPNYNGFKMMLGPGLGGSGALYGADIRALGDIAETGDYVSGAGSRSERPVFDAYVGRLLEEFEGGDRPLTVAWDAGNGAAGEVMTALTRRLPGRHLTLFADIDGTFPNHHPDPTVPETLADLCTTVTSEGCDLGIAFDGDGDRIGVVDGQGRMLYADQLLIAFARDLLDARPGATVIADVKASQVLFDAVADAGGAPLMYKTGHSLIKAKMKEIGAPIAGEMSGHIFFADRYYGFDDALYAAVRLLRVLANGAPSLAELHDGLPPIVNTPELRFPCAEDRKVPVIEEVRARLAEAGAEVDATDGVRVSSEDGWWLLRASNTQDVLVARCEAGDEAALDRLKAQLSAQLAASGLALPDGS